MPWSLVLIWAAYYVGSEIGESRGERNNHSASYERHAEEEIRKRCLSLSDAAQAECISEVIKATNEHKRAQDDLVAQSEMATWALGMFIFTAIATGITALGVWFVKRTLDQTAQTNEAAVKAALAAQEANTIMRFEQRPWLTISCGGPIEMDIRFVDREPVCFWNTHLMIGIENRGKMPAYHARLYFDFHGYRELDDFPQYSGQKNLIARAIDGREKPGFSSDLPRGKIFSVLYPEETAKHDGKNNGKVGGKGRDYESLFFSVCVLYALDNSKTEWGYEARLYRVVEIPSKFGPLRYSLVYQPEGTKIQ